ncbi:putative pectinesterase [Helianthus debilis subsp. tardiflorus]
MFFIAVPVSLNFEFCRSSFPYRPRTPITYPFQTVFFGVYRCWGPGAAALRGVSWARELNYDSAHKFLAKSFVNGRHWIAPSDA